MATEYIDTPSGDYLAMAPYWRMVNTMIAGAEAMRAAGETYLPKFESESREAYNVRKKTARFTNIFGDIIENLSARPFSKEIQFKASTSMLAMLEDVDGRGTHISRFLQEWFDGAMKRGIEWVLVDYAKVDAYTVDASGVRRRKSVLEERQSGARPYAVRIEATDMIAVYSDMINGREEFVHARMKEVFARRKGYLEETVEQIRILNREPYLDEDGNITGYAPATYELYEQVTNPNGTVNTGRTRSAKAWKLVDSGDIAIGRICLHPLIIGERMTGWRVKPAMNDAAELQKEYFEQENGLKNIKALTAYPMLTANGVSPPLDKDGKPIKAPVGPRAVLYAPPTEDGKGGAVVGSWSIIEPAGTSLNFLKDDLKELAKELRELGRQPLVASSGNMTTITAGMSAQKSNSAIQNWAQDLGDSAENFLKDMAEWAKDSQEPEVMMDLDFSLEYTENDTFSHVIKLNEKKLLSNKATFMEGKRRGIIAASTDWDKDQEEVLKEMPEDGGMEDQEDLKEEGDMSPDDGDMSPEDEVQDNNSQS